MSSSTTPPPPPERPRRRGLVWLRRVVVILAVVVGFIFKIGLVEVRGGEVQLSRGTVRYLQAHCSLFRWLMPSSLPAEQQALESRLGITLLGSSDGQVSVWAFVDPKTRRRLTPGPDGRSLHRAVGEGPADWHPANNAGLTLDAILYEIDDNAVHSVAEAERLIAEAGPNVRLKFSDPNAGGALRTRDAVELSQPD